MGKRKIIYAFDPLCSWCYGFHSTFIQLKKEFDLELDFELKSGGLIVGKRIGAISEKAKYLKKSIPDVERITGVKFGEKYLKLLDEGSYISNSIPPSIAFNVLKSFRPDLDFEIGHAIQKAYYQEGKDLNSIRPYFDIAEEFEINKFGFMERYQDPIFETQTLEEFELVKSWGADNYPAILLQDENGEVEPVSEGYVKYETLLEDFKDIAIGN
jgi:putative protein-disulfide isomerase